MISAKVQRKYRDDAVMSRLVACDGNVTCLMETLRKHGAFEMTLEEVGDLLGISRERVRQIERAALRKLSSPKTGRALKRYTEV
jgi:DNA-directed RNA polymerase sigma subunit (sigma70/sigma32)